MKRLVRFFFLTSALILMSTWRCCFAQAKQRHINLVNSTYSVVYDPVQGVPLRVSWRLRPSDFAVTRKRVTKNFKQDARCPKPRIKDADYCNSGYMRGHLCPAADRTQTKAMMKETFLMSNVAPMSTQLNCGAWSTIESITRKLAIKYDSVDVLVGTVFTGADSLYIAGGRVHVPSLFFRRVATAKNDSLLAYWLVSQSGVFLTPACITPDTHREPE
jgi:DNA/RNA endonuclease G (NUC1)